jgi:hypothetical protein
MEEKSRKKKSRTYLTQGSENRKRKKNRERTMRTPFIDKNGIGNFFLVMAKTKSIYNYRLDKNLRWTEILPLYY